METPLNSTPMASYDHKDERIKVFHERKEEYDAWFDQYPSLFRNELKALRSLWPIEGRGLEIGVGSARFSVPLGIREGWNLLRPWPGSLKKKGSWSIEEWLRNFPFSTSPSTRSSWS